MSRNRRFLDVSHPMFRPLWTRALAVVLLGGWTVIELVRGQFFWAILFGAATGWLVWNFFVAFKPEDYE